MAKNPQEKLLAIRHSAAHVLAAAVLELWPEAKFGVGPVIQDGFYYDFELPCTLTPKDLARIEKRMRKIIERKEPFTREELTIEDAERLFRRLEQAYKLELISDLKKKGTTKLKDDELMDVKPGARTVSIYHTGRFVDLCQGPHVASTDNIGSFALTKIAGAYWRGDAKNKMLQRVYGLAFATQAQLDSHCKMLEEAEKRDHRKIGKELALFTFSEQVGSGLPLFTPEGTLIRNLLTDFVQSLQEPQGYERVWIPHLAKSDLYKTSGHWDKFKDDLFHVKGQSGIEFVIKPMNCPHHTQIYSSQKRSYRDLPIRYSEVTTVYRDEQAGELLGLSRVRAITQDDAHVFCTSDQTVDECLKMCKLFQKFYKTIKMPLKVRLSLRDSKEPQKYLGDDKIWEKSERTLREVLKKAKLDYKEDIGEAAFYGPKIDFIALDSIGREWQLGTVQLDFNLPERFHLTYIDSNGKEQQPVMIHRALLGAIERFMAILIEHYAGAFPVWLSPVQVAVMPVGKRHQSYSKKLGKILTEQGIRIRLYDAHETIGYKIRTAEQQKIPYMLVIGDKEAKGTKLTVRKRGSARMYQKTVKQFIDTLLNEIEKRK